MVLQKRLDYGFIGYQVPPIPRAKRSARGRAPYRKKVEDNRTFAFDLLATVAGKLLLEEEFPPTAVVNRTCHDANVKDGFNKEPPDKHALPKVEPCDQGNTKIGLRAQELAFSHGQNYKGISDSQHSACSRPASGLTISDCSVKISSDPIFVNNDKGDFSTLRKFEGSSSCPRESSPPKLEDDVKQQNQSQQVNNGDMSLDTGTDICGSEDPKFFNRKPHALVSADNGGKVSMCKDHCTCGSPSLCRDNVTVVSRDDDENSSGCTQPSTSIKSTRSLSHIGDCRIRKLLASKYWRLAPKVKDGDLSDTGGEILPIYHSRKNGYKRQRSQRIYPLKKRRLFDYVSVSNSKGELGCNSIYDSTEKARDVTASGFGAKRHGATDASSSVAVDNASFLSRDPRVKVRIKSFRIPELFIEIPETATVGSLKRTVLEAVTALLGDGLHVGVLFQGKKIRDDNRTLLQSGISHDNKVDALGFTLEPSPSQAFPPMHFEGHPLLLSDDSPLPVSRCSLATSIVQQGAFYPLAPNPATNVGSSIESDHDSAPSPEEISTEKGIMNTRALVPVPDANAQALAVLPLQQKSKRTEMAQRRIRRPFSVSEVEALVQAVEKLGTGRWRDVKLRAFDNVKHRTYVDLKDKWKTLVHTARISPQQRRGEPVPQELLDRVLTAHSYWSQQQAKHQLKQQSEACLLA